MGDDAEKGPQQGADQQPPDGYLLLPRRDCRRRRKEGLRDFGAHGVGRRTSSVAGSRCRRKPARLGRKVGAFGREEMEGGWGRKRGGVRLHRFGRKINDRLSVNNF